MQNQILYMQANFVCLAIVFCEIWAQHTIMNRNREWILLTHVMWTIAAACAMDMAWGFISTMNCPLWLGHLVNQLYFFNTLCGAVLCFFYSEEVQENSRIFNIKWLLPVLLPGILCLMMQFFGKIYWLDDTGYHRGSFYWLHLLVNYGYLAVTGLRALAKFFSKQHYAKKSRYLSLIGFVVFPLLFSIPQFLFKGLVPMACVGQTIAVVMAFQSNQAFLISTDELTGLNNRNRLAHYLSDQMREGPENLCLMFLDVDHFKLINDTYGHNVGDQALIRISEALKAAVPRRMLLARYSGDEFIVCGTVKDEKEAQAIVDSIHKTLKKMNGEKPLFPMDLTLSVGKCMYSPDISSIPDFIAAADRAMYRNKPTPAEISNRL